MAAALRTINNTELFCVVQFHTYGICVHKHVYKQFIAPKFNYATKFSICLQIIGLKFHVTNFTPRKLYTKKYTKNKNKKRKSHIV